MDSFHLVQLWKGLGHLRCSQGTEGDRHYDMSRRCFPGGEAPTYHRKGLSRPPETTHGCISLLLTCRRVYCEAIEILYGTNIFDVNHPQTLPFLAQTLRPRRLESIRYLQIHCMAPFQLFWTEEYPDDLPTVGNLS